MEGSDHRESSLAWETREDDDDNQFYKAAAAQKKGGRLFARKGNEVDKAAEAAAGNKQHASPRCRQISDST